MSSELVKLFFDSFLETLLMVGLSGLIGAVLGIPLGVTLNVTEAHGILPHPLFNRTLGLIVNAVRSTPFIILLVAVIPFPVGYRFVNRHRSRHRAADHRRHALRRAPR